MSIFSLFKIFEEETTRKMSKRKIEENIEKSAKLKNNSVEVSSQLILPNLWNLESKLDSEDEIISYLITGIHSYWKFYFEKVKTIVSENLENSLRSLFEIKGNLDVFSLQFEEIYSRFGSVASQLNKSGIIVYKLELEYEEDRDEEIVDFLRDLLSVNSDFASKFQKYEILNFNEKIHLLLQLNDICIQVIPTFRENIFFQDSWDNAFGFIGQELTYINPTMEFIVSAMLLLPNVDTFTLLQCASSAEDEYDNQNLNSFDDCQKMTFKQFMKYMETECSKILVLQNGKISGTNLNSELQILLKEIKIVNENLIGSLQQKIIESPFIYCDIKVGKYQIPRSDIISKSINLTKTNSNEISLRFFDNQLKTTIYKSNFDFEKYWILRNYFPKDIVQHFIM